MLHGFLQAHRTEVLDRCGARVAGRARLLGPAREADRGLESFLDHVIESLRDGEACGAAPGSGGPSREREPAGVRSAALRHGGEALRRGLPIDHVVREYGDLAEVVTELTADGEVPDAELLAFHRCVEMAAAEAVAEFDRQRQALVAETDRRAMAERLGFLAHELRNFLNTAMLSFAAIRSGSVAVDGATASVLERSLGGLRDLIDRSLEDVREGARSSAAVLEEIPVETLIADVRVAANLDAGARACEFVIAPVEPGLTLRADRKLLNSAISNLVQNAFKFTSPHSHVLLRARGSGERVLIEVEDRCGGLPPGKAEALFALFAQHHADRSGLGLGLSISRRAVENCGGTLSVRDMPGLGCVFTIDVARVEPRVSSENPHTDYVSLRTDRVAARQ